MRDETARRVMAAYDTATSYARELRASGASAVQCSRADVVAATVRVALVGLLADATPTIPEAAEAEGVSA